jgi:hypothetical protein
MWGVLPRRTQVLVVAAVAIALAWAIEAVVEWVGGEPKTPLKWVSLIATLIVTPIAGVAGWLWRRLWRLSPWIERNTFPDLTGVWEGHLVSTWRDAEGRTLPPIPVTMLVRQGLLFVSIKMRTAESASHSTRSLPEADREAQRFRVWYSYENRPDAAFAHRSSRHDGVAWLEMDYERDPDRLVGQYFTERKTNGDIDLRRTSREVTLDVDVRRPPPPTTPK